MQRARINAQLGKFIAAQSSFFIGTADAHGQPYIQHRGGPPGFLRVLDETTLGFADYSGNRQYVTVRNLAQNPKAYLFLIDYAQGRRIKIRGEARADDDPALVARLMPEGYEAAPERAILFTVHAWEVNCPRHIPRLVPSA
jgi:predicted pyridoxine 5'-phosphate oxidase superfamily flavin-nucleotide-binding protein